METGSDLRAARIDTELAKAQHFFDIGHPQGFQPLVEHMEKQMALAGVPMALPTPPIVAANAMPSTAALR